MSLFKNIAMLLRHTLSFSMRLGRRAIFILLIIHATLCSSSTIFAFQPGASSFISSSGRSSSSCLYSSNGEYSQSEVKEMERLIVSLSKEPTDESRRSRLGGILTEALAKPNGAPKRFTDLFDRTLIEVGDRVRAIALEKALEAEYFATSSGETVEESSVTVEEEESDTASGNTSPNEDDFMSGKTDEEKQVWALVDMMVQSKTIVKKANGELGSSSEFA